MSPAQIASQLRDTLLVSEPRLRKLDDGQASFQRDGKWSPKQILGHLIDSASNNHQRFVRMQLTPHLESPGYQQDEWVRLQRYQERPWVAVIGLWLAYNLHLAHVIDHLDPNALQNTWASPDDGNVSLEFAASDYLSHLRHHINQLFDRYVPVDE